MKHELKTWPENFQAVWDGTKRFEVRKNDRNFRVGDTLLFREFFPDTGEFSGRQVEVKVSYVLHGIGFGITNTYCALGFISTAERRLAEVENDNNQGE